MMGCVEHDSQNPYQSVQSEPKESLREVESASLFGTHVEVIMVREHEYIVAYKSGMVHSESCPNSKHDR